MNAQGPRIPAYGFECVLSSGKGLRALDSGLSETPELPSMSPFVAYEEYEPKP